MIGASAFRVQRLVEALRAEARQWRPDEPEAARLLDEVADRLLARTSE